jgi:hypothetical protein
VGGKEKNMNKKNNILREAGVLLVVAILVLTALVMVPITIAFPENDWPGSGTYYPGEYSGWTDQHKIFAYYYGWRQSDTTFSGGNSLEAYIPYYYCRANYVFYSYAFSTVGYSNCRLEFLSYINHYQYIGLYSLHAGWSTDASTWHPVWSEEPGTSQKFDVSESIPGGQSTLYIGFWVEGDPFNFNYWYIDNVDIIEESCSEDSVIDALNAFWDYIDTSLPVTNPPFKNPITNTKNQLKQFIIDDGIGNNGVIEKINNGDISGAIDKLTNTILPKIDGDNSNDLIYDPTDPTLGPFLASWLQQIIDCLETL